MHAPLLRALDRLEPLWVGLFLVGGPNFWPLLHFGTRLGVWGATFCLWFRPSPAGAEAPASEWTHLALSAGLQAAATRLPHLQKAAAVLWITDGVRGCLLLVKAPPCLISRTSSLQVKLLVALSLGGAGFHLEKLVAWAGFVVPFLWDGVPLSRCLLHSGLFLVLHFLAGFPSLLYLIPANSLLLTPCLPRHLWGWALGVALGALLLPLLPPILLLHLCDLLVNGEMQPSATPKGPLAPHLHALACLLVTAAAWCVWLDAA